MPTACQWLCASSKSNDPVVLIYPPCCPSDDCLRFLPPTPFSMSTCGFRFKGLLVYLFQAVSGAVQPALPSQLSQEVCLCCVAVSVLHTVLEAFQQSDMCDLSPLYSEHCRNRREKKNWCQRGGNYGQHLSETLQGFSERRNLKQYWQTFLPQLRLHQARIFLPDTKQKTFWHCQRKHCLSGKAIQSDIGPGKGSRLRMRWEGMMGKKSCSYRKCSGFCTDYWLMKTEIWKCQEQVSVAMLTSGQWLDHIRFLFMFLYMHNIVPHYLHWSTEAMHIRSSSLDSTSIKEWGAWVKEWRIRHHHHTCAFSFVHGDSHTWIWWISVNVLRMFPGEKKGWIDKFGLDASSLIRSNREITLMSYAGVVILVAP